MTLEGKTAIITGAARGMGFATTRAMAKAGARIIMLSRSAKTLEPARAALQSEGIHVKAIVCDVSRKSDIDAALAQIDGPIDILVNNAGIAGDTLPVLEMSEAAWDEMLTINLKGPFLMSQAVARLMQGRGGVILNNASISGLATEKGFAHYCAAKAGLISLTRSMAVELAPLKIKVNAISPGYTRTDMTMEFFDTGMEDFLSKGFDRVPIKRLVEAEEVASAFVFLASDAASGITGANLVVDGGLTANHYIMETFPKGAGPYSSS
jgi:NAD(P)-dependent dehydrogenase (short-subunit alcohol dehydrogenase family)